MAEKTLYWEDFKLFSRMIWWGLDSLIDVVTWNIPAVKDATTVELCRKLV